MSSASRRIGSGPGVLRLHGEKSKHHFCRQSGRSVARRTATGGEGESPARHRPQRDSGGKKARLDRITEIMKQDSTRTRR